MRVLIINARYHGGGAERCGRELFERLPQLGVSTNIWLCQHDRAAPPTARQLPLRVSTVLESARHTARRVRNRFSSPLSPNAVDSSRPECLRLNPGGPGADNVAHQIDRPGISSHPAEAPADCRPPGLWERVHPYLNDLRHIGFRHHIRRVQRSHVDIVHLHVGYPWCTSLRALSELCRRVPVVWTLHDDWAATGGVLHDLSATLSAERIEQLVREAQGGPGAATYHRRFQKAGQRRFLERWMPQPTALVAPSTHLTRKVRDCGRFPESLIAEQPNGVSLLEEPRSTLDRSVARAELGLDVHRPVMLMIASEPNVVHKGFRLGAAAIHHLKEQLPRNCPSPPQILLLGRHGERLQPLFPGCDVRTRFTNSNAELATAYRAADITLIPSLTENFPYVALESLACRTPVIGFRVGGLCEIVAEHRGGRLVTPYSVPGLAEQCHALLASPADRTALAEAGHEWVARQCGMDGYLQRIAAIYRETIAHFDCRRGEPAPQHPQNQTPQRAA